MPLVLLFDLNGTLLDLSTLDQHFQTAFGDAGVRQVWFEQLLQLAMTTTITGPYVAFDVLAAAALEMVAARRQVSLPGSDKAAILAGMSRLPAFPDVPAALTRLRDLGIRLAALTNSTPEVAQAQVAHAQLTPYFEQVLSADAVQRLKPAPEPYQMAVEQMGVVPGEAMLVAAHSWDTTGALRAGLSAAFVARPGQTLSPLGPAPEVAGTDLAEACQRVLARGASESNASSVGATS